MHSLFLPSGTQGQKGGIVHPPDQTKSRIETLAKMDWPIWTAAVAILRQPGDIGLGDTVVHIIGDARSERFKAWFQEKFGKSCGCTKRQRWLNARFPYQIIAD